MSTKKYIGNGKYCYTNPCSRHDSQKEIYANIATLIDRKDPSWGEYYTATERKHLSDKTLPGSKFTDPTITTLNDLMGLAHTQRGNLDGDDRNIFIQKGIAPEVFKPGFRYLHILTPGKLGIVNSEFVNKETLVTVVRTKPGAPCNYMLEVDHQPEIDYGVIILEDTPEGQTRLITTFPGYPTFVPDRKSETVAKSDSLEGQTLTVSQVHEIVGRTVNLNTRLKHST